MIDPSLSFVAEHRFGYGLKAGQMSVSGNPGEWLLNQLKSGMPKELSQLPHGSDLLAKLKNLKEQRKELKGNDQEMDTLKEIQHEMMGFYLDEVDARFRIFATTDSPFLERLVWFWSNHFTVSGDKHITTPLLGAYEREALRPHVTGYFGDMLRSSIQHPAMIIYLDNQSSISPELGERRKQRRLRLGKEPQKGASGINENLAREIMELHTLGVDGGYTQTDVTSFAHVLTGWNLRMSDNMIEYMDSASDNGTGFGFVPRIHDDSSQAILGKNYNQQGIKQGEAVLSDLAHHPSTARHIARKLVQHFIADDPPAAVTQKVADAFTGTGGYLPEVYKALLECDEAWQPQLVKSKTAIEYVASTLRLFPEAHVEPKKIVSSLDLMGQKPWFASSPQGWPDVASRWITPDGLWKRVEWSQRVAVKAGRHIDARALAASLYGPLLSATTRSSIEGAETGEQALALLLLSPEFQRR